MIESRRNETLKAIRGLRRRQGDEAVLEGPHLLTEALAAGLDLGWVLMTPAFAGGDAGRRLVARLSRAPLLVDEPLLAELADADSPRGAVAVARLPRPLAAAASSGRPGIHLFLDGVQDPGNLGALARVAEAFGAAALWLGAGCVHPNHPRALRASAGSLLRLLALREAGVESVERALSAHAPRWVGLEAHGGKALPRRAGGTLVVALGAEGRGLGDAVAARLDERWTIPLAPPVESLNVAVAAGIVLHALRGAATALAGRS